jgi:hypothetical protein
VKPLCSGHAVFGGETTNMFLRSANLSVVALGATDNAKYERDYAANVGYQTRYLLIRLWASLIGANPKTTPAEMVGKIERK